MLKPGFMLPPLMFSEDEIEALVLGSRRVAGQADQPLGAAALNEICHRFWRSLMTAVWLVVFYVCNGVTGLIRPGQSISEPLNL